MLFSKNIILFLHKKVEIFVQALYIFFVFLNHSIDRRFMNHYAKWLLSVFLMGFISATALAAGGGGHSEGVPFPVPLSCYSEDAGS